MNVDFDLKYVDGKVVCLLKYDGQGVDGELKVMVEPEFFLDKLKEAIPGKLDDKIIDLIKAAFLSK